MSIHIIPLNKLSSEALQGVIEEYISRDGTDYGDIDVSAATKFRQVKDKLENGLAVLIFDDDTETTNLSCVMILSSKRSINDSDSVPLLPKVLSQNTWETSPKRIWRKRFLIEEILIPCFLGIYLPGIIAVFVPFFVVLGIYKGTEQSSRSSAARGE
jgi:uncharacterized protein